MGINIAAEAFTATTRQHQAKHVRVGSPRHHLIHQDNQQRKDPEDPQGRKGRVLRDHGPLHEHRPQQELHFNRDQARGLRNKVARLPWSLDYRGGLQSHACRRTTPLKKDDIKTNTAFLSEERDNKKKKNNTNEQPSKRKAKESTPQDIFYIQTLPDE